MPISVEPWQPLLEALAGLRAAWPIDDWSWDQRFKCVTCAFETSTASSLRNIVETLVPSVWTAESLGNAPDHVRALEERCGNLRPGQLLFTGAQVAGMVPFAMWWPWGDGAKISVRLGIANCDRPKDLYPQLRGLFGIT